MLGIGHKEIEEESGVDGSVGNKAEGHTSKMGLKMLGDC